MPLLILRLTFIVIAAGLGVFVFRSQDELLELSWVVLTASLLLAGAVITIDVLIPRKRLDTITSVYFGTVVGLFLAYVVGLALIPLPIPDQQREPLQLMLALVLCYLCISLLMQTRDDFRFIIPYIEFSKEVKGLKPYILDTSVIIDGRIADVLETKIFDSQLIMPRFVLAELQAIADSSDKLRRGRGRRGLDMLNRLRAGGEVELQIYDRELPEFVGQPVDLKLVMLAKHLEGKIVTNDFNLNKVAKLQGVGVINLNDLANALKPVCLPGEVMEVRVIKPGEEFGQGVGYLDDGTMVVIENARDHVSKTVAVTVNNVLQTSAGRMIFARYDTADDTADEPADAKTAGH